MPIVPFDRLLRDARRDGYAVGYFEAWDATSLEAVLDAAEAERAPVVLGFGGMMTDTAWLDRGGVELCGAQAVAVGTRASVPVSLIFNEAQTFVQAERAVASGFNAVMLDSSAWAWDDAVAATRRLAALAHAAGATVEAELGRLPDATLDGAIDDSEASLTDPDAAARFVTETGIDALAVSVGNVHLLTGRESPLDLTRLEAIARVVEVPLVLHGGTGLPVDRLPAAIAAGVAKINVGTTLKREATRALRATVDRWSGDEDVHRLMGSHKRDDAWAASQAAVTAKVRELIRLYGGAGRAA